MRVLSAIGGGLAGAFTLTFLNEIIRRIDKDAPRMDLLGMDAVSKGLNKAGQSIPDSNSLFAISLLGDMISNTFYYSLAAAGNKNYVVPKGAILGLAGGLGALVLPAKMGLNPRYSNKTLKTQLLTTGFYLAAGMLASLVSKAIEKKKDEELDHHPQLWV